MENKKVATLYEYKNIDIVEINGKRYVRLIKDGTIIGLEKQKV
ncbi:hypothetical protein [Gemella sanguinis]|nr:hypothetical protein [Gemella sanguinis]